MGYPSKGKGKGKGKFEPKGKGKGMAPGKGTGKGKGEGKGKGKADARWVKVKPTVLVTGAGGFVAMSIVRRLLDKHYKVRGTVRSLGDEGKVGPLKKLFPALELFEADLLGGQEAFDTAMAGCTYVLHVACPFTNAKVDDPQKELVDPSLKGAETVLKAAIKAGVSRVVLTSSCAAVGPPQPWINDPSQGDSEKVFTEEDWNTTSTLEDGPYRYAKTVAERRAWEMVKDSESLSLVTILPSFVIGPMMSSRVDAESMKFIKGMLDGTTKDKGASGFASAVVDVRDVSLAQVAAMETEEAGGKRFMVTSEKGQPRIELANMIRDRFKAYPIPTEGDAPKYVPQYNVSQAREILKFKPRPVEISMRDMVNAAIRNGIVERKVVLRPVKFGEVKEIMPDSQGVNLLAKVVSVTPEEDLKDGSKSAEVVVGDATGVVTMRLRGDEVARASTVGEVVEVRNAYVKMLKGFVRLQVGKWGKITTHEGDTKVEANLAKDVSATEYELVSG